MKKICECCLAEFDKGDKKRNQTRFCSKECRSKTVPEWLKRKKIISQMTEEEKLNRYKSFFYRDVVIKEGCWEWKGFVDKDGYPRVICRPDYGPNRASRASVIIHNGFFDKHLKVIHLCDNKRCTNPEHLRLGTSQENSTDMVLKKRQALGSKNGNSKLDEEKVLEIKKLIANGMSYPRIAKMFNVGPDVISSIKRKKTWKHVQE